MGDWQNNLASTGDLIDAFSDALILDRDLMRAPAAHVQPQKNEWTLFRRAIKEQLTVIGALILRDMRTRFGRTHLGFIIAIIWPLSHMGFMMLGFLLANRIAPIGNSSTIFVSTGVLPYILFFYPARLMMISAFVARPLLYFPIVRFIDVIYARIFLEVVSAIAVLTIFTIALAVAGVDVVPMHPENLAIGIGATIFLGIGCGTANMVITMIFKPWQVLTLLGMIGLFATSGAFVVPSILSAQTRYFMSYNPLYQSVTLFRSAYYDGFYDNTVNPMYLIGLAAFTFVSGIVSERLLRGRILET